MDDARRGEAMSPERREEILVDAARVAALHHNRVLLSVYEHRVELLAEVDRLAADRDAWQEAAENMADRRDEGLKREGTLQAEVERLNALHCAAIVPLSASAAQARVQELVSSGLTRRFDELDDLAEKGGDGT